MTVVVLEIPNWVSVSENSVSEAYGVMTSFYRRLHQDQKNEHVEYDAQGKAFDNQYLELALVRLHQGSQDQGYFDVQIAIGE